MASNVSQEELPYFWSSANDDIIYRFSFNPYSIDSVTDDGGFAKINLQNDFDVTPLVGEYLYILGSIYNGRYQILTVIGTSSVTINTPYAGAITSNAYNSYHLRVPTFDLYKGFTGSEIYVSELPYERVIPIKPPILFDELIPRIEINVMGLTSSIFSIESNTVANSVDFSMFNAIRLLWDGLSTVSSTSFDYTLVLNSAITNDELIENYIVGGKYLIPNDKPIIPSSGTVFYTIMDTDINQGYPTIHKFVNGIKV